MPDDRDSRKPKHGPLTESAAAPRAETAVPERVGDQVTGQTFESPDAEDRARFQRDMRRGMRALSLKIAAGNKVFRDELRASRAERDRRRADEADERERKEIAKVRRDAFWRFVLRRAVPAIIASIGGVLTALGIGGKL